jgi:hypothetical protein
MLRLVVVLFACVAALAAQQRVPLDGSWEIRPETPTVGAWRPVAVPAAFEAALGVDYDGVARYRRRLSLPPQRAAAVRVEFDAVATHATVLCNGQEVGRHLGGWTPFRVDLTAALRWDGENTLEVIVDEKVGHNTQGFLPVIQPHFGGIWQSVTLCLDDGPTLDRFAVDVRMTADGLLDCRVPVLGARSSALRVEVRCGRVDEPLGALLPVGNDGVARGTAPVSGVRPWSPADPALATLRLRLLDGDRELDRIEQRLGFRDLRADGTRVLWNGAPFQLRGVLHWGFSPPHLAPPADPAWWRPQLARYRAMGFNTLKCCLWMPPRCVYELCDELGLAVWQEYPTWHPRMDAAHKQELRAEYAEFFAFDRMHPSVAFRSITCETGHGADLDVVRALYDDCKAAVPQTLVVDDSSWIGWQRVTDFWDEHPYGNNSWFPGRLADFRRHIAEKGEKPLLLGECIAADTWVDRAAWRAVHGDAPNWWRPLCWDAQTAAEAAIVRRFGEATLATLGPESRAFALRNRKFQCERLRLDIPEAGYVVSVARDFPKARMGLDDDLGRPKWTPSDWGWHGDTMLCLDASWDGRSVPAGGALPAVRVAHAGTLQPLSGSVRCWLDEDQDEAVVVPVAVAAGAVSSPLVHRFANGGNRGLRRIRLHAELTGSHAARNHWDLWCVPHWHYVGTSTRVVDRLTPELLDELEAGARVLLRAGDRPGSLRTEGLWFLRGAPFAPPHPAHKDVPARLLFDLCSFDLETGRVLPLAPWGEELDPLLGFWETHDLPEVRMHAFAAEAQIGKGRLLATTLRLDGPIGSVGFHVQHALQLHLEHGPAPRTTLSPATLAALRGQLTEQRIGLTTWRFRTDPDDKGRAAGWSAAAAADAAAPWRDLAAGKHWEAQADDLAHYTGVAWYRAAVDVPATWRGATSRLVLEGVDDSYELWLDGAPVAKAGDPATKQTIWLEKQVVELGDRLAPGRHVLALRVVDHAGAGGLWRPAYLTTGPAAATAPRLH